MIIFDATMTLIESFILSYFNFKVIGINNKKLYLFLNSIICFCEIIIFNNYILNNYLLLVLLLLTNLIILYFITKEFNLYYFIIPAILISILLFSNTISLIFVSYFFRISPKNIGINTNALIILSLCSRVLYLFLSLIFYYVEKNLKLSKKITFKTDYWIIFCVFTFIFLGEYTIFYEAVFYEIINNKTIYIILFQSTILTFLLFIFYFRIKKYYYNHLLISNELMKRHYTEEMYKKTNKLSYQILQEKHQMFYILIKIQNLLKTNDLNGAISFIDIIVKNYQSYEISQTLNIPAFDYHILSYINSLKKDVYIITPIISITNTKILENIYIIQAIKECIKLIAQYSTSTKQFELQLHDNNSYLILKLTTKKQNHQFPQLSIKKSTFIKKININHKENDEIELNVLFFMKL